ncbi:MAG: hypothetical protein LKKZDAJK_002095 [Candidatus Fervidibacter sp.]
MPSSPAEKKLGTVKGVIALQEMEWLERLWQQVSQLAGQVATKQELLRLEERLMDCAHREMVERLIGKVDTLLINAATKLEVARLDGRWENAPTKDDVARLEAKLTDAIARLPTKQDITLLETRLEKTPTRDEWQQTASLLLDKLEATERALTQAHQRLRSVQGWLLFLTLLNGLLLSGLLFWLVRHP